MCLATVISTEAAAMLTLLLSDGVASFSFPPEGQLWFLFNDDHIVRRPYLTVTMTTKVP